VKAAASLLDDDREAPTRWSDHDILGWLLFESGRDRPRGLALLEQAARGAPGNAEIGRHLAAAGRS
jgi:hypothetical protein